MNEGTNSARGQESAPLRQRRLAETITRYDHHRCDFEAKNGEWVKFADHAAALAERDEAIAARDEALRVALTQLATAKAIGEQALAELATRTARP